MTRDRSALYRRELGIKLWLLAACWVSPNAMLYDGGISDDAWWED